MALRLTAKQESMESCSGDTSTELDTEGTVFNVKYSSLTFLHSRASFQQCAVPWKEEAYDKAARYSGTAKSFYLI